MRYLISQDEFEALLGRGEYEMKTVPSFSVVYFSANWCGPCRSLDTERLQANTPGVNWLKCDIDQNNYTPGYCGVRSIPSFVVVKDKKAVGTLQSNDTDAVIQWVKSLQ